MVTAESAFEFGRWPTPFENEPVEILEAGFSRSQYWSMGKRQRFQKGSILNMQGADLVIRLWVDRNSIYRVRFECIEAFRVLDENGLNEFWAFRPQPEGRTTFRVRNDAWSKQDPLPFMPTRGWSFVVASDADCVQVVANVDPEIGLEPESGAELSA